MSLPNQHPLTFPHFWELKKILPIFDASYKKPSVVDWIQKVESLGAERNWTEENLMTNAIMRLEGSPHRWYEANFGRLSTWKEFKEALIKQYSADIQEVNIVENITAMMAMKNEPAESTDEDDEKDDRFCNVCSADDHVANHCPSLEHMFKPDSDYNMYEYYEYCRKMEEQDAAKASPDDDTD